MARVLPIAPAAVPTLDELSADPTRATALPAATLHALLCRCATVQTVLMGALLTASARTPEVAEPDEDKLLDVPAAARRLSTTTDWLYRHARQLPFTVRAGRQLRFSARGIDRFIRERQGLDSVYT